MTNDEIERIRERAVQIAYARFYEGLPWDKSSEVGRKDAEDDLRADDVFAALAELVSA